MVLFEVEAEGLLRLHAESESPLFFLERKVDVVLFLPARGFVIFSIVKVG